MPVVVGLNQFGVDPKLVPGVRDVVPFVLIVNEADRVPAAVLVLEVAPLQPATRLPLVVFVRPRNMPMRTLDADVGIALPSVADVV
jgi:hypothetical protein